MSTDKTSAQQHTMNHLTYRPDIDGLRAVAVLFVVIYHAFPSALPGGFIGVDIFFIISGFLISTILFQSVRAGSFNILDFYSRRIRRIFPALSVVFVATGIFGWFTLRADEFEQLGKHIAAGAGFISNLILWNESGYFDTAAETKPLLHLWSLGIEEQFYFFFPIVLWLAWKFRQNLMAVILLIATLSFTWGLYQYNTNTTALFYSPLTRFWELLIGSLLAYISLATDKRLLMTSRTSNIRAALGSVLIAIGVVIAGQVYAFPGVWALFPTIGAALVISAGPQSFINKTILSHKFMVFIGLISYPLYLWHWPLLSYARIIEGRTPSITVRILCVAASFFLAYLTFQLLEKPLRNRVNQRRVVPLLVMAVSIIGVFGFAIYQQEGFKSRPVNFQDIKYAGDLGHVDFHSYVESKFFPCTPQSVRNQAEVWEGTVRCSQSKNDRPIDTVLLGDSHAEHLFIGLAESLSSKNIAFYTHNGMSVRSNSGFDVIFDAIDNNPNITQVIINSLWSLRKVPVADLTDTIRSLQASGKTVYVTDDIPDFSFDPELCKFKGQCEEDMASFAERYATYSSDLEKVVSSVPGIKYIKSTQYLCNKDVCHMGQFRELYYRDRHHLNILGSMFIAGKIVDDFPELKK